MFSNQAPDMTLPFPAPRWQSGDGAASMDILDAPPLDSETAALFRASLQPLFLQSTGWPGLIDRLRAKGYGLAFRDGRLILVDHPTGAWICSLRFLGMTLVDLVARLGRPIVRALPGCKADAEFLRTRPQPAPLRAPQ